MVIVPVSYPQVKEKNTVPTPNESDKQTMMKQWNRNKRAKADNSEALKTNRINPHPHPEEDDTEKQDTFKESTDRQDRHSICTGRLQ